MLKKTERIPTEAWEQAMLVQWFRRAYPGVLLHSIPNGGKRSKSTAMALKVEGTVRGIPDLFIPEWRVWVEMKRTKGGSLSPEQKTIIAYLKNVGYTVLVCKGFEAGKEQISKLNKK